MRERYLLLAGISLVLALHSLAVSRFLASSFFLIVCFCWLWVGMAALFDRLAAARAMATTMIVISLVVALPMQATRLRFVDARAFYFLAMLPALIAWICVHLFIRHLEKAEDVTGREIDAWFENREAEALGAAEASGEAGERFAEEMMVEASRGNDRSSRQGAGGLLPDLKAAS